MVRDRDEFESGLDRVIAAHGRKVRAEIDACACGTAYDWKKSHEAEDTYFETRDTFLDDVFAPPPPPPAPVVVVVGREEQQRGRTRGRPLVWQRWVEVRVVWKGVLYTLTAKGTALVLDEGAVAARDAAAIGAADFDPLDATHTIRFRGLDYEASDAAPPEVKTLAIEACRKVAQRLLAQGVDDHAVRHAWPEGWPPFAEIVAGKPAIERAA